MENNNKYVPIDDARTGKSSKLGGKTVQPPEVCIEMQKTDIQPLRYG